MKNPNIVKCIYCGKDIDITKATTDVNHEFVRFVSGNLYLHKKCFTKYEKKIRDEM